ncbi:MAG: family 10 glycosylhydrolase [Clostridia bacterium]|nr:family 10 glycosylhydrolase [Clostridia bacterium]
MKKRKVFLPLIFSVIFLSLSIIFISFTQNKQTVQTENSRISEISVTSKEFSETISPETENEMHGIWIPYMSLTLSSDERSKNAFENKINIMAEKCLKYKINTVIIQVRPFGDAIYPSKIFPYSHIIMGTQGISPDFDPLDIIIKKFHEKNISVHAWVNPLRISTGKTPISLSDNNPYKNYPTFTYDNSIYYNPAYPEVRKLIIDGIGEIVRNYDIEGIQLDDYFYPSDDTDYDKESYQKYAKSVKSDFLPISQHEWRKANINMLIEGIYSKIHSIKNNVVFGIAPQCNFDNNEKIGADVNVWCSQSGYIDYICPQLYVSNNHPTFPFNPLADKWKATVTNPNIKLYFGLGMYKAGSDADNGTWLLSDDNLQKQIEYSRAIKTNGFMLYSYEYLENADTEKEVKNAVAIIE